VNLYPGWARAGWGLARPWNTGWYGGWSTPSWGWWGARAAAWGIGTLATAAIINDAVDDAIDDQVSYIVVPNSNYQLLYGTVTPAGGSSVTFDVTDNGTSYRLTARLQRRHPQRSRSGFTRRGGAAQCGLSGGLRIDLIDPSRPEAWPAGKPAGTALLPGSSAAMS